MLNPYNVQDNVTGLRQPPADEPGQVHLPEAIQEEDQEGGDQRKRLHLRVQLCLQHPGLQVGGVGGGGVCTLTLY